MSKDYSARKRTTFWGGYNGSRFGRTFETRYSSSSGPTKPKGARFTYLASHNPDKSRDDYSTSRTTNKKIEMAVARRKKSPWNFTRLTRDLSRTLDVLLPSLGFVIGAVLLSGNITGDVILNSSQTDANLAGAFAIIIGLIGLLVFRRR